MDEFAYWERNGKDEINKFLWLHLPSDMTIGEAEGVAAKIHQLMNDAWAIHRPAERAS